MQDPNEIYDPAEASKCLSFLRLLWKFCRCIFSHVTLVSLVVAYCVLGAWTFAKLEAGHEKEVKESIKFVRSNVTEKLWKYTQASEVLIEEEWTREVIDQLGLFEKSLVNKMKKDGWDGDEDTNSIQWTFAGALFYSIIVITTIGYGHIAPKTQNGKIVTIFYAILGIPLMLLCLSNIGDVMASSFRFLYWKICCYVCTRPPKPTRSRHSSALTRSQSLRQPGRYASSNRSSNTAASSSFRRSIRASQRSAESVLPAFHPHEGITTSSHSETDCSRCRNCTFEANATTSGNSAAVGGSYSLKETSPRYLSSTSPSIAVASPRFLSVGSKISPTAATRSLDRKVLASLPNDPSCAPVLFNKYAVDEPDVDFPAIKGDRCELELIDDRVSTRTWPAPRRCHSVEAPGRQIDRNNVNPETVRPTKISSAPVRRFRNSSRPYRREASSARIMSPMGFAVHRQIYVDDTDLDYDYLTSTDMQSGETITKPVPIWLCVFLVVSYIFGGAFLFTTWEEWPFLDSAYFCFITLTTIGFGDLVPAHRLNAEQGIALCSLYLLFGIALLAMSFNLVQEEVINNVKNVAKRLGILKEDNDGENYNDEDDFDPDADNDNYLLEREENRYYSDYERSAYTSPGTDIDRFNDRQYRLKLPNAI